MAWNLNSVYELNKESPYTFYLPSEEVLEQLKVGDLVKLIFFSDDEHEEYCGERMWVEITYINGYCCKGLLANEPIYISSLVYGQEINFYKEHICDTQYEDPNARKWDYYFDFKVVVSNEVLEKNEFNFLMKDNPRDEHDTGWTIFSGYEEEGYNEESNNFQYISIGVVLNIDDSILSFINDVPFSAYERDESTGVFYKVEDYDWDSYLKE
jgi:hypothetical protein